MLTPEQSAASAARFQAALDERGFGFWAVEVRGTVRIRMTRDPDADFDDPTEPEGPLRRNVLYGIRP